MSNPTNKNSVLQYTILGALLTLFWLLMSGHYTVLINSLGIVSICLVIYCSWRMDVVDHEVNLGKLHPIKLFRYYFWLFKEIVLSNMTVAKYILSPSMPIKPNLIKVHAPQKTEIAKVFYANSITLTPGTVSLDIDEDLILVHALNIDDAQSLHEGEMAIRVSELEVS